MNESDLRQLADAVAQVLRPHMERSDPLRRAVGLIGKWLVEQAEREGVQGGDAEGASEAARSTIATEGVVTGSAEADGNTGPRRESRPAMAGADGRLEGLVPTRPAVNVSSAYVPLRLGDAVVQLPISGTTEELGRARLAAFESRTEPDQSVAEYAERTGIDLAMVETRSRLKAASCRLFVEKRAAGAGSNAEYEIRHRMNEMIAKAKAMPSCFLWVFWRERTPPDDGVLAQIAECYDAQADVVGMMRRFDEMGVGGRTDEEGELFRAMAEANSALRVALGGTWLTGDDEDQVEAHVWLRQETASRRVFIDRHMTAGDPADPSKCADLRERLRQIGARLDECVSRAKAVKSGLSQIKYHAGQIVKNGPDEGAAHWAKVGEAFAKLRGLGIAAADRRVAEAIGPRAARGWTGESSDTQGLAAAVARAAKLETDPDAGADATRDEEGSANEREWSQGVVQVRTLLRGKRIVVIGGERNAAAVDRFIEAFELADAEWVTLAEHGPSTPMRGPINRADTAAVVVIIKLAGHLHAEEARGYASSAGKPCIHLSGGYNPERVAEAILDQASNRLHRDAPVA